MADHDESQLVIEFEDTGESYDASTAFQIQSSFLTPSDAWSCTVANEEEPWLLRRKFYPGRPVRLYLGDRLQLIGRIGRTRGVGGGSGALQVTGRDYFADILDPQIDPTLRINNRMSLADALVEGLRVFGITEVESSLEEVTSKKMGNRSFRTAPAALKAFRDSFDPDTRAFVDALPDRKISVTEPVTEAKPRKDGEGAFRWASRLAGKYHLSVQPGSKRSAIALVAPDYDSDVQFSFSQPGNVETATCERNGEDVPTFVNARGRFVDPKKLANGGFSGISMTESESGFVSSNEGRKFVEASGMVTGRLKQGEQNETPALYKPLYFSDDRVKSADELKSSAAKMTANKLRNFFSYRATLNSHVDVESGATYATNTLADVQDAVEDVSEKLWIVETSLVKRSGQGKRAEVKMMIPGTYVL